MRIINKLNTVLIAGAMVALLAPLVSQAADVNVTIGSPGYYQPSYERGAYQAQTDWAQEREARRQRALEWRDHHSNDQYADHRQDRMEAREHAVRHERRPMRGEYREGREHHEHREHHDNGLHRGQDDDRR